ncbi:MAG TPA: hypothetical protein PLB25_06345 [Rhodoferax sp.]|nr:hypothetical protein [Rhodoferax sp.]
MNTTDTALPDDQNPPTPPKKKSRYVEQRERISAVRRANFAKLCDKVGTKEMMEKMEWETPSQRSQLLTGNNGRAFPESMARRIEWAFSLEVMSLDKDTGDVHPMPVKFVPAGTNPFSQNFDGNTLATAMDIVGQVIAETSTKLTAEKQSILSRVVFELVGVNGWKIDRDLIGLLVNLGRL